MPSDGSGEAFVKSVEARVAAKHSWKGQADSKGAEHQLPESEHWRGH